MQRVPNLHKALTVKNPYASLIADGFKTIEVRKKNTHYRGPLLITSSAKPVLEGMQSGALVAKVVLAQVKKVSELTEEEWAQTWIKADRKQYKGQYAYFLNDARKLIEMPVKGNLGIFNLAFPDDEIIEYPTTLHEVSEELRIKKRNKLLDFFNKLFLIVGLGLVVSSFILLPPALIILIINL